MNLLPNIKENVPKEVVVLSDAVYHSYLGRYFLGQTDMICFGESYNAWGALVNPKGSNINMFLNAYTISNFSDEPFTAEGWLSSTLPGDSMISRHFAAGNQAISPPPQPMVNSVKTLIPDLPPKKGQTTPLVQRKIFLSRD